MANSGGNLERSMKAVLASSTDIYVTGWSTSGTDRQTIIRCDANGNEISHVFHNTGRYHDMTIAHDGNLVASGYVSTNGNDVEITKYQLGNLSTILWNKTYGGAQSDYVQSVKLVTANDFLVGATTNSKGNGSSDAWLIRLNQNGDLRCNSTTCTTPNITSGLVAQFDFTGNANDVSGNANNGTVNGATLTTDRFGNLSSAYNFDGNANVIDCGNSSSLQFTNNITFSACIKAAAFDNMSIVDKEPSQAQVPNIGFRISTRTNGEIWAEYGQYGGTSILGGYGKNAIAPSSYTLNTWTHVVGVVENAAVIKIYINGQLIDTTHINKAYTNTNNLLIGRGQFNSTYEGFNGIIDDIRIYNRPLTDCDIDSLYSAPNPLTTNISERNLKSNFSIYPNPANINF